MCCQLYPGKHLSPLDTMYSVCVVVVLVTSVSVLSDESGQAFGRQGQGQCSGRGRVLCGTEAGVATQEGLQSTCLSP